MFNAHYFLKPTLLAAALALAACDSGSSSSDSGDDMDIDPGDDNRVMLSGLVSAPSGSIAYLDSSDSYLASALNFIVSSAHAAITGLTPVANSVVELYRIDNDGNAIGDALAMATSDADGKYSIELPDGVEPSADLIVEVSGNGNSLRALAIGLEVDITPLSQYILDNLIDSTDVDLGTLDLEALNTLVDEADSISIDLSSVMTLESALSLIAANNNLTDFIDNQIDVVIGPDGGGNDPQGFEGQWNFVNHVIGFEDWESFGVGVLGLHATDSTAPAIATEDDSGNTLTIELNGSESFQVNLRSQDGDPNVSISADDRTEGAGGSLTLQKVAPGVLSDSVPEETQLLEADSLAWVISAQLTT